MRFIIKSIFVLAIAAYFMPQSMQASPHEKSFMGEVGGALASLFTSFTQDLGKQVAIGAIASKLSNGEKSKGTLTESDLLTPWQGGKNRINDQHARRN